MSENSIGEAARKFEYDQGVVPTAFAFQAGAIWSKDRIEQLERELAEARAERDAAIREMETKNSAAAAALERLWQELVVAVQPQIGPWGYPLEAYRIIMGKVREIKAELDRERSHYADHKDRCREERVESLAKFKEVVEQRDKARECLRECLRYVESSTHERGDLMGCCVTESKYEAWQRKAVGAGGNASRPSAATRGRHSCRSCG